MADQRMTSEQIDDIMIRMFGGQSFEWDTDRGTILFFESKTMPKNVMAVVTGQGRDRKVNLFKMQG